MRKETDELRIIKLRVIPDENEWVKLPPEILRALEITPENILSFYADKEGFRVKGTTKPLYFHASTEQPQALCKYQCQKHIQNHQRTRYSVRHSTKTPQPHTSFTDATQQRLFDLGYHSPRYLRNAPTNAQKQSHFWQISGIVAHKGERDTQSQHDSREDGHEDDTRRIP